MSLILIFGLVDLLAAVNEKTIEEPQPSRGNKTSKKNKKKNKNQEDETEGIINSLIHIFCNFNVVKSECKI